MPLPEARYTYKMTEQSGDCPEAPREAPETLSILSWNVENLARHVGADAPVPLEQVAERFGHPDVICLQEVRIRPQDLELVRAMQGALAGYSCSHALANDPMNVRFRGGRAYGVATYVKESPGARLGSTIATALDEDREGRLVVLELPRLRLALFDLYAVNGTSKPYYDHTLGRVHGDRHAFKRRFHEALMREATRRTERGLELILIGDWNISRTTQDTFPRLRTEEPHARARRHLNQELVPALDLVDAFRELHPSARRYTWFNRLAPPGTLDAARVDYALISRSLLPRVLDATIHDTPAERGRSDHAPLTLKLRR